MARHRGLPPAADILRLADASGRLLVRVTPGARADAIMLPPEGTDGPLQVRVTQAPEDGKANAALLALLGKALGVPRTSLEIVQGAAARTKTISLPG